MIDDDKATLASAPHALRKDYMNLLLAVVMSHQTRGAGPGRLHFAHAASTSCMYEVDNGSRILATRVHAQSI